MFSWALGDRARAFVSRRVGRACSGDAGGGAVPHEAVPHPGSSGACWVPAQLDKLFSLCCYQTPSLQGEGDKKVWDPLVFLTSHRPHLDKALLVPGCYHLVTLVLLLWPSTLRWSTLWCSCPCLCLFSLCLCPGRRLARRPPPLLPQTLSAATSSSGF